MANIKTLWRCPVCRELHPTEAIAEDCCELEIKQVLTCGLCNEEYGWYEREQAEKCCQEKIVSVVAVKHCLECGNAMSDSEIHDSRLIGSIFRCRVCIARYAPSLAA